MRYTVLFLLLLVQGFATAQNTVAPCVGMAFVSSRGVVVFGSSDVTVLLYMTDSLHYEQISEAGLDNYQEYSKGVSNVSCWFKSDTLVSVLESVLSDKYEVLTKYSDLQLYLIKTYGKPKKVVNGKKLKEQWQWIITCGKQKRKVRLSVDWGNQDAVMYYGVELLSQAAPNGAN